jgi:glycosyltransferase involved in cell wall biosynthesis
MRVGIYVPGYRPDAGGGYTLELAILRSLLELVPESPHEYTIFAAGSIPHPLLALKDPGVVRLYDMTKEPPGPKRLYWKLKTFIAARGRSLGHLDQAARELGIECIWFLTPVFDFVNVPYIATVWDLQHRLQPWFPEVGTQHEWRVRERIYSNLIQLASYVITGTAAGMEEISLFYQIPRERIRILPLPTPTFTGSLSGEQVRKTLEKYHLEPGFLLYPAQFWPHKNHANLLLALSILGGDQTANLDLVLVGSDKGNREYIQSLAKQLGLEGRVHFLGFVERDDLVALYQSAFALTFVTYFGPDNLPPLEAFALGCPVIASAVEGAEEQLGDAALLADPRDPDAIASAVKYLLENPGRRAELIERGIERASRWTAKDFVRSVFGILDEFERVRRAWG